MGSSTSAISASVSTFGMCTYPSRSNAATCSSVTTYTSPWIPDAEAAPALLLLLLLLGALEAEDEAASSLDDDDEDDDEDEDDKKVVTVTRVLRTLRFVVPSGRRRDVAVVGVETTASREVAHMTGDDAISCVREERGRGAARAREGWKCACFCEGLLFCFL